MPIVLLCQNLPTPTTVMVLVYIMGSKMQAQSASNLRLKVVTFQCFYNLNSALFFENNVNVSS